MERLYGKTISGMERFNQAVEKYAPYFLFFAAGYFTASILRALA
jgi:hypothetical protein